MSQVYVSMAMSLDGFITGPHDDAQHPAGINGMRLMDSAIQELLDKAIINGKEAYKKGINKAKFEAVKDMG